MSQMPMETILLSNDNISVCGTTVDKLMRDLIARPCQKKKNYKQYRQNSK